MFLLVMAGFIAGCGQKGPLYREAPSEDAAATEQTSNSGQSRDDDSGDR